MIAAERIVARLFPSLKTMSLTSFGWLVKTKSEFFLLAVSFGLIKPEHIPENLRNEKNGPKGLKLSKADMKKIEEMGIKDYVDFVRDEIMRQYIEKNQGYQAVTANELKISDRAIRHFLNPNAPKLKTDRYQENLNESTIQ